MKKLTLSLYILSIAFFSQAEIRIPEETPRNVLFGDPFVLVEKRGILYV